MNYFLFVGYPLLMVAGLETVLAIILLQQNTNNSPIKPGCSRTPDV